MRCRSARILMTRQLREALPPSHSAALARHLAACAGCRKEQEDLASFAARLLAAKPAPVPVSAPPPVARRASPWIGRPAARRPVMLLRVPAPAALAAAVLVTGLWMLASGRREPARPGRMAVVLPGKVDSGPELRP